LGKPTVAAGRLECFCGFLSTRGVAAVQFPSAMVSNDPEHQCARGTQ
jgi:hypothetical protein